MKNSGSATPVTDFAVPPHAPAAVVQAKETFDNVASKYVEARDALRAAKAALSRTRRPHLVDVVPDLGAVSMSGCVALAIHFTV